MTSTSRGSGARPGDKILINGTIGDHGMAVLASREGLELESDIRTDSAPLNTLVADLLGAGGSAVHALRDPTRGGVATTLKEIALQSEVDITLEESALPVRDAGRRRLRHPRPRPPLRRQRRQAARRGRPRSGRGPPGGDERASPRTGGGRSSGRCARPRGARSSCAPPSAACGPSRCWPGNSCRGSAEETGTCARGRANCFAPFFFPLPVRRTEKGSGQSCPNRRPWIDNPGRRTKLACCI